MVRNVTLTIDHKSVTVPENTTILEAARSVNINIPTLCYLKDINEIGACRICCVEVEGMERLVPACDNVVADGMVVFTNSAKAREARRMNLRLILSHHDTSCTNCTRSGNCTLQQLANDFNMRGTHFPKKLRHEAVDYSTPLIRENDKCVQCLRCIQVCENVQSVKIWDLLGTGSRTVVDASYNRRIQDTECTYCGQCITHCPTGGLRERDEPMFEKLRSLRAAIAREEKVPPYIVFSDKTLVHMCIVRPSEKEEMLTVTGVGEFKYQKYGERFLECVREAEKWNSTS